MKNMKKVLITIFFLNAFSLFAQEGNIANMRTTDGSSIFVDTNHFKEGDSSYGWTWKGGSQLVVSANDEMNRAANYRSGGKQGTMRLWIYNEKPSAYPIQIAFKDKTGKAQYYFPFNMKFVGWRACWIRFDQMYGDKAKGELAEMTILAPRTGSGTIYLDRMKFLPQVLEYITPDAQIPFVESSGSISRWLGLWPRYSTWTYDVPLAQEVTAKQQQEFDIIYRRVIDKLKGDKLSENWIAGAKKRFYELDIKHTDKGWTGKPIVTNFENKEGDITVAKYAATMNAVAKAWYWSHDSELGQMYLDMLTYFINQGFDIGSSMGSTDLYGYNFREIAPSMCLARPLLEATGNLEYYADLMGYWADIQNHRQLPQVSMMEGYCDMWLTQLPSKVYALAMIPNTPKKLREFQLFQRWMSNSVLPTLGTFGGMKPDGMVFHHWGNYPGYSAGAMEGIGIYLQATKQTSYQLSEDALVSVGKALEAFLYFSQGNANGIGWGWATSGRGPLSGNVTTGMIETMAALAETGKPFTHEPVWKEFAEQYLRLVGKGNETTLRMAAQGVLVGNYPQGNKVYNYAAMGVHRMNNWVAIMKGYNKHVWCTESYAAQNRFGRYLSYGTLQIIPAEAPDSKYYKVEGWDWNRFSGATIVYLPIDSIVNPLKSTLAALSDEVFAGASNLKGKNGIFAQKLHEADYPTFTPSHRARKSMFTFDDVIVCLGTGIENQNKQFHTETVLWQQALNGKDGISVNGRQIKDFPVQGTNENKSTTWLTDPMGNSYYIAGGQEVIYKNSLQKSRNHQNTNDTENNYSVAYINHGISPKDATYHYFVAVQPTKERDKELRKITQKGELPYLILQQDNKAHIVANQAMQLTDYAIFEAQEFKTKGDLLAADGEALVMIQKESNGIAMSVCHPHLNLEKACDSPNDREYRGASRPMVMTLTLAGEWKISSPDKRVEIVSVTNGKTVLRVSCTDGIPVEYNLIK